MFQGGSKDRIELWLVQVGLDDTLLEVVQHHVAAGPAEVAPRLFVQACPGLLARLPHDPAKAAPGVAQGHYKQARLAKPISTSNTRECALAVIDLGLFAGGKLQTVKLLGFAFAQPTSKTFDAVVSAGKTMVVHQVLVDGHVVSLEAQLGFDERAVGFAVGGRYPDWSRWPGWRNLIGLGLWCAGGHPGGICPERLYAFGIGANGLAINSGDALNMSVAGV